ncbi:MAG: hypothetical protein J6J18_06695 [Oscillospiraceae bacterium]|nr:hypothetical protein [Oscillospiraceae bacterium]
MATAIGWIFLALYIFIPYRFLINSVRTLIKYFRDEGREYDLVPGTIVKIEKRTNRGPKNARKLAFYALYQFCYQGKTYHRYSYRLPARLGPGLRPVPAVRMKPGDPVQVRVYRPGPEAEVESRIEERFFFWKSRLWVHIPVILICLLFIGYGLYCAYLQLTYVL